MKVGGDEGVPLAGWLVSGGDGAAVTATGQLPEGLREVREGIEKKRGLLWGYWTEGVSKKFR